MIRVSPDNHFPYGQSVVNYLLRQQENFNLIDHYSVGDFNTFSNRAPLEFPLRTNINYNDTAGVNPYKYLL